jgi:peroxiredoxin
MPHGFALAESPAMADARENAVDPVPQTLEGFYVLHDVYTVDWPGWRALGASERSAAADEAAAWLGESEALRGDSALYSVLTQKGDLMFVHYRETPDALNAAELGLRQTRLYEFLRPAYSYFSVIEVSLYEVMAMAMRRVADRGLERGTPEFDAAMEEEIGRQKERMNERLFRDIPPHHYICFYPMNKRRGEQVNWYSLPLAERRAMMRSHGTIGHKYHETVTQVIAGSVGLDDWEWGVSLHCDDALTFKKLIYEMRFDPASALYAEFGPFYVGIRREQTALQALLEGRLE